MHAGRWLWCYSALDISSNIPIVIYYVKLWSYIWINIFVCVAAVWMKINGYAQAPRRSRNSFRLGAVHSHRNISTYNKMIIELIVLFCFYNQSMDTYGYVCMCPPKYMLLSKNDGTPNQLLLVSLEVKNIITNNVFLTHCIWGCLVSDMTYNTIRTSIT